MVEPDSLSTIFPSIPKTVWRPGDPEIECLIGELQGDVLHVGRQAGFVLGGPHIALNSGFYGVEFQLSLNEDNLPANLLIAQAQVSCASGETILAESTISAGQLAAEFGGMYQGIRLDVIVERRVEDVEFRIISAGNAAFSVRGVKLVPRPGHIWFPYDLDPDSTMWALQPDRSAICNGRGKIASGGISLPAGDHRLGVKLKPPVGMTTGTIAAIQIVRRSSDGKTEIIAADPGVTTEAMLANHGVPDAKLRFQLEQTYHDVTVQVEALLSGVTVQWIRLATADEAVWHHYYNLGGSSSALGQPVSGFLMGDPPAGRLQFSYRGFEGGLIVWTVEHGPCEVYGTIKQQYEAQGGLYGKLGCPTGRPRRVRQADGSQQIEQDFESGRLHDQAS